MNEEAEEEKVQTLTGLVNQLREEVNLLLAERETSDDLKKDIEHERIMRRILEEKVESLENQIAELGNPGSSEGEGDDGDGTGESDGTGDGPEETNKHVDVPDAFEFQNQQQANQRKSIEYTPELAYVHQLHEFDDAPSVGTIHLVVASGSGSGQSGGTSSGTSSGSSVTLKLVDPDGNTAEEDTSCKWMVPLRQMDGNGKVLHWARIGNSVTFDVGSIVETPCPPTIEATLSGNSVVVCVHSYEKVDGNCVEVSGSPECVTIPLNEFNLNCEDVRDCVNDERTVLTGVTNTGSGLVFTRERIRVASHVAESSVTIDGTTCEGSGES